MDNRVPHRRSTGWQEDDPWHRRRRGPWYYARRASVQSPVSVPPFSARGRAMRLDVRGIDHLRPGRAPPIGKLAKQSFPHAAPRPAHEAIVDRRQRAVLRRTIAPSAAALRHMQDTADDPPVIDTGLPAHVGLQERGDLLPLMVIQSKQVASHFLCSLTAENHRPALASMYLFDDARGRHRMRQPLPLRVIGQPMASHPSRPRWRKP